LWDFKKKYWLKNKKEGRVVLEPLAYRKWGGEWERVETCKEHGMKIKNKNKKSEKPEF